MSPMTRLVLKIYRFKKNRETYVCPFKEYYACGSARESESDIVRRIAEKAKCDWLLDARTGEARFFV